MLRRISAYTSLISLLAVSLAPMATTSYAAPRRSKNARHVEKKTAPEFASAQGSSAIARVLIQTKGAPSAAHDAALNNAGASKRSSFTALNTIVADVSLEPGCRTRRPR